MTTASLLGPVDTSSACHLLLAASPVQAGFPSPAEDFAAKRIDLNAELIVHPQATFLMRAAGVSMVEFGIGDRDLMVVDRAIRPRHGLIVVAVIDAEFTVKQLHSRAGRVKLKAGNPTYPDIVPQDAQELTIWGVVTHCIKSMCG
ncbi:peptidase [Comamonas serinivorans]|uniref:Peptidase n=1 Tax=Comamonas serinivorans TaxID=1082851 RepID=A0A1Y0EMN7_9BURK|nr:translesion error-prone DNA polymerase V autoproteolytic subunit [Comamonas serinivorans]ARU04721.1 peptidase [Comamonas serinivorans]